MLIYIIHGNNIYTFRLPKEVSGNYMLNDFDIDGKSRSLINISSKNGKWYFNSNSEVSVYFNGSKTNEIEAMPYNFYTLNYYRKEYILLYIFPGFESNYIIKNVPSDTSLIIGNDNSCDIVYKNDNIAPKQMQLDYKNGIWYLMNLDRRIPIYLNKNISNGGYLSSFDSIFIMGLKITIIGSRIIISSPPNVLSFTSNNYITDNMQYATSNNPSNEIVKEFYNMNDYFFKSPIFKKKYDEYALTITPPDTKEKNNANNIIFEIVPSALMSITSLVSLYFSMINYRSNSLNATPENIAQNRQSLITSVIMCTVMLVTGILWPIIEHSARKIKFFISSKVRVVNYKKYLKRKEKEMQDVIAEEKSVLFFNNISLQECQTAIFTKNSNLFSRNIDSYAFLKFRCGTGRIKSSIKVEYKKPDMIVQSDKLYDDIDALIEKYKYIDDATFVTSIKNTSLAVINPKENYAPFMNAILLQLISLHDYSSLKIVVLTKEGSNLSSIKNLNHCWNNERTFRYYATNLHEAENISSELVKETNRFNSDSDLNNKPETYYIIVSDCIENYKSLKIVEYILKNNKNDDIIKFMSLLMFTDKVTNIPTGCEFFINYSDNESSFFNAEMDEKNMIRFKPSCIDDTIDFYGCIERLSNIPIKLNISDSANTGTLPTKLGFLEMYGVGRIEQLNILERWKNAPISSTLAAPIGVDANGNILSLDLHEKKHGPHGLIAGMTGSGKSEFIVTYILSLAINYSPDEVQFVLIDYKGGGLAGAFENRKTGIKLPHLIGTITNLDKAEMNRTLVSIKSELQRRQKVFNAAKEKLNIGSIDIYKYQMLVRDGSLTEPMSHLFIFCDEFAELKDQQPDFMDELISAARIGRSLGVHLILATQKPSGVVDDQIWSNSKFKVCCKVQTADDSSEMIRRIDAAYIKESGRFYLQVGYDEYFVLGQSAYSGVQYIPSEIVTTTMDNSISFINNNGDIYRNTNTKVDAQKTKQKENLGEELGNILNYIVNIAKANNYSYHQLWLDNVPKRLFYGNLVQKYNNIRALAYDINPIIGEYDDPETQSQGCVQLPITGAGNTIILGNSGSGKSTLLSTLIFSSIINHTNKEVNFYILDFGSEKFNSFKAAPHVGDVLTINDKNRIRYFFYMIEEELNKRQKYYSDNGGDFVLDIKNGKYVFPNIVVIIYGLESFKENFYEIYDGQFMAITRLSAKVGIEFIISASSSSSLGLSLENNFKQKVLLQLSDESDYAYIFKGSRVPSNSPGRGLILQNNIPVEFQTALICEELKQKEYLDSVFAQLAKVMNYNVKKVPELSKKLSLNDYLPLVKDLKAIPLGVNVLTAQQEYYNFNSKITLFSAQENKNTMKFFNKFSTIICSCPNTNLIILNAEKEFNLKVDLRAKYYNSDFAKLVNLLYSSSLKFDATNSDKKFVILIIGYVSINNQLKKLQADGENIKTLDELVKDTKNDNFKFFIYELDRKFESLMNSDISDILDNYNGIWIGVDYDNQEAFEMQNIGYRDNSVNPSNELIVIIRDSEPIITRYPTIG